MDNQIGSAAVVDDFYDLLSKKIASTNEQLRQVRQTIDQSQSEIARLTQRASTMSAQLQKSIDWNDRLFGGLEGILRI